MNTELIQKIDAIIERLNSQVRHPYFFQWSPPEGRKVEDMQDYFCVWVGKHLVMHSAGGTEIIRGEPVLLFFYMGRIQNTDDLKPPENIASWFAVRWAGIQQKHFIALESIARGFHDVNYSEYNQHEFADTTETK